MSNQESFIREVDEEYRREQTAKFFKTYGVYLIVGAFVVLAIVGGYKYWQSIRAADAARGGDALSAAITLIEAGNQDESERALASLAGSGPGAYRVLARLHAAAEAVAKRQFDSALQDYRGVAADASAPQGVRDFAQIQIAALSLDKESYEVAVSEPRRFSLRHWRMAVFGQGNFRARGFQRGQEGRRRAAIRRNPERRIGAFRNAAESAGHAGLAP